MNVNQWMSATRLGFTILVVVASVGCEGGGEPGSDVDFTVPPSDTEARDSTEEDTAGDAPTDSGRSDSDRPGGDTDPGDGMAGDVQADSSDGSEDATSCGGRMCGPGEACLEERCVPRSKVKCQSATDLGVLKLDDTTTITGSFAGSGPEDDAFQTGCAADGDHPEKVYRFSVATNSQIDVQTSFSGFDAKLEFRQGSCMGGTGEYGGCRDSDGSFFAPGGSTFFLILEQDVGTPGDFEVKLTPKASCSFGAYGEYGCKMGNRYLCEQVNGQPNEKEFVCPSGCRGGDCIGGSCSKPIVIQAGAGFSETYTGDLASFTGNLDFKSGNATCSVQGQNPTSRGREVYFRLKGLQKGQTVTVDTSNDKNANLVFFANNCSSAASQLTCAATGDENGTMTVPSSGNYFVIVDKYQSSLNAFDYRISIE